MEQRWGCTLAIVVDLMDQLVKSTSDLRYNVPSSWPVAFHIDHSITLVIVYTAIIENNKLI